MKFLFRYRFFSSAFLLVFSLMFMNFTTPNKSNINANEVELVMTAAGQADAIAATALLRTAVRYTKVAARAATHLLDDLMIQEMMWTMGIADTELPTTVQENLEEEKALRLAMLD